MEFTRKRYANPKYFYTYKTSKGAIKSATKRGIGASLTNRTRKKLTLSQRDWRPVVCMTTLKNSKLMEGLVI